MVSGPTNRLPAPTTSTSLDGLTAAQVSQRRSRGEVNVVQPVTTRSYGRILRDHAFTPINTILYVIAGVLVALGLGGDALLTVGLVLLNVVVGMVQETRAKRKLDRIALLARPRAVVIRDGQEQAISPDEIVRDDLLVARPGSQILVDGTVVRATSLLVDESLLTGESDPVSKPVGAQVVSGSFAVGGSGVYRAEEIGEQSLAQQMTRSARTFREVQTPLQREIGLVLRGVAVLALALTAQWAFAFYHAHHTLPVRESVQAAAVLVSLVPQGLSLMITVVYAIAAVRMSGKGALIQRMNAIESSSHVDTLCLDKTGTLTSNRLLLNDVVAVAPGLSNFGAREQLATFAASVSDGNRTIEAILAGTDGRKQHVTDEIPFSSERKWSALVLDGPELSGAFVLGAPEMLAPAVGDTRIYASQEQAWQAQGLRVLLFAAVANGASLRSSTGEPCLPARLEPLALLSFADELRPEARSTIDRFVQVGVAPKIISGDNPETVAALARQSGISVGRTMSGLDIDSWDNSQLEFLVQDVTIFGRVTPDQKERIIQALRRRGHYVAMIGDGVNDVPALKQADLAVAMASGSEITRSVSDVVLLGDSFAALPKAFEEGQRILHGMQDIVCLFLARTLSLAFVILVVAAFGDDFPITPKHNALLALLTVGIPTMTLAAWAEPGLSPRRIVVSTLRFVIPAALTIAFASLTVFFFFLDTLHDVEAARTALTTVAVLCGIGLILFVEPPSEAWVGGHELRPSRRQYVLAALMLVLFEVSLIWLPARRFFDMGPLPFSGHVILILVVIAWSVSLRFFWRWHARESLARLRSQLRLPPR